MTVAEVLPGVSGWYTQILTPLTSQAGRMFGVTYPDTLWRQIISTWNEESKENDLPYDDAKVQKILKITSVPVKKAAPPKKDFRAFLKQ